VNKSTTTTPARNTLEKRGAVSGAKCDLRQHSISFSELPLLPIQVKFNTFDWSAPLSNLQ
jgi:hypothetical protein